MVGDPTRAARLGGMVEALDYSKAVYAAQQAERPPAVPGPGAATRDVAVPDRTAVREVRDPQPARGDVERAVQIIRERLRGGVSHDDLEDIQRTLLELTPADASAAFGQLRTEELQEWATELADSGRWLAYRGYDDGERGVLFDRLAQHLDGTQLARFGQALDATGSVDDNRRLGAAVGGHARPEAKVEFVRGLLTNRLDPTFSDGDAVAVAMALRGMGRDGARSASALRGAGPDQLEKIVAAGLVVGREPAGLRGVVYDAEPAMQVLQGIASTGDARLMGAAFVAASTVLERTRPRDILGGELGPGDNAELQVRSWNVAEREVRRGMTALLDADTNGVVDELKNQTDREAPALVAYAEALIEAGDAGTLARHLARLQRGNRLGDDPLARFTRDVPSDHGAPTNANAARLGHFVGAVSAAFDNRGAAVRADLETFSDLMGYVAPELGVDVTRGALARLIVDNRVMDLDEARQAFEASAYPRLPDGRFHAGDGQSDYTGALNDVVTWNDRRSG